MKEEILSQFAGDIDDMIARRRTQLPTSHKQQGTIGRFTELLEIGTEEVDPTNAEANALAHEYLRRHKDVVSESDLAEVCNPKLRAYYLSILPGKKG